jgi:hypothetical protein
MLQRMPNTSNLLDAPPARSLLETDPTVRSEFYNLPGIFWFDQFRNLGVTPQREENGTGAGRAISSKSTAGRVYE